MEKRRLGKTGMEVTRLGLGLAEIGYKLGPGEKEQAERVLNEALDRGINFLDTSACYRDSEDLIGEAVSHRRDEYFLATKAGHSSGLGSQSWTAETVTKSIERSLKRLRTDYLDLVQLHSCGVNVLEQGDVIRALEEAKEAGKTRFIGYSGDNEAAKWAVESGLFDTLQTSFSLADQWARMALFPKAEAQGMGIIAKRPIANAVMAEWVTRDTYSSEYFDRVDKMMEDGPIPGAPEDPILLALGFTLGHDVVDTAIVGTKDPDHVRENVEMVKNDLPISEEGIEELHRRFDKYEDNWRQRT